MRFSWEDLLVLVRFFLGSLLIWRRGDHGCLLVERDGAFCRFLCLAMCKKEAGAEILDRMVLTGPVLHFWTEVLTVPVLHFWCLGRE